MRLRNLNCGFTAAEMLVATMVGAVVIGAAALAYATFVNAQQRFSDVATVRLTSTAKSNFYGISGSDITTYVAPNYGSLARAEALRERFITDTTQSVAVYCLYRANAVYNTIRPASIASPPAGTRMDTPELFRTYLSTAVTASATVFTSYRNVGTTPNYTVFILGFSQNATTIPVIAVYDVDFVEAKNPSATSVILGTYASVRRYVSGTLTGYYDVIYRASGQTESFVPPVVAFERRSLKALVEGNTTIDRFKVAAEQPFYFIFWPDPAVDSLALPSNASTSGTLNGSYGTTDVRRAYNHMAGRTSFMFTLPMFPST
ncbi:MAG: type II secretion system protein J [Verrucomicrobium sp.]|nr:hypothetical protein [Verrucomicrobium sp.]